MSDIFSGLASLSKSVQETLNSYEVRKISDKVQSYVMNFTEPEMKVREATTEEPWGPTPDMMREVAGLTFQYDAFPEIMGMLWKRMLPASPVAWRHTYKSLILLEYLLKNGCERVISNARDHAFEMRSLEHYKCIDERGKDQGINVRHRVKAVLEILEDDDLLREERRKAKAAGKDEKYRGYSRDDMMIRGHSSSSSSKYNYSSRNDDFSKYDNDSRYDRDDRYDSDKPKREVTAFGFDDAHPRNVSPELGIRADSPDLYRKDDDDEFGDFTVARSGVNNTVKKSETFDFGSFKSSLPPPPGAGLTLSKPTTTTKIINDDLFGGFTKSDPISTKKDDEFDFLGLRTSSQQSTTTTSNVIRPPSGASSPIIGNDLFDMPANNTKSDDFFGFASPTQNKPTQDSTFDFLGLSTPASPPPSIQQTFPQSHDLFPEHGSKKCDDDFLSALRNISPQPKKPSNLENNVAGTQNNQTNKSALWNDLSGSLDLDNLLSTKPKQSVSLNELKSRQGMSSSNSFM